MIKFSILFLVLFLSACSPINTEFSCGATARDQCLSIEQVDAMTQDADEEA